MHRILPHITVLLISSVGSNITVLSTGDVTLLTPCVVGQTETIEGYVTDMGEYPGPLSAVPTTISFSCNVSCPTLTSVSVWCVHHCNVSCPTLTSVSVWCVHHCNVSRPTLTSGSVLCVHHCNVSRPTLTSGSVLCVHHCNVSRPTLTSGSVLCVHHHLLLLNLSLERTNWYLL